MIGLWAWCLPATHTVGDGPPQVARKLRSYRVRLPLFLACLDARSSRA